MTIKFTDNINCPRCGASNPTLIWDTLNVQLDPEDKQALLGGKINGFHCQRCGFETLIIKEFLYHDMEKEFCVQYYPFEGINENGFLNRFTGDGKVKMEPGLEADAPEYFKNMHVVFGMDEMVRYVLFRDRLADREHFNK